MSRSVRAVILASATALAVLYAYLGYQRYATYHNETFDLAFYTRMAWGYVHGELWEPIVGANVAGLHLSPVVLPFGILGELFGSLPTLLLIGQAAAITAAAWPLARMGYRRLGGPGALLAAGAWLLFPNLGHVATYEFHPGTIAVLPMAFMLDALDRGSARAFALSAIFVLLCREDLGLVTGLAGLVAFRARPELRRTGGWVAAGSFAYVLVFALVLHPLLGPRHGSMQLHFGKWGDTVPEAALSVLMRPGLLVDHLTEPERLAYLPKLLFPLALLPLLRPRWLLIASPLLAMNLLSEWPTTIELDSHYQTTMLPMLVAGAVDGAARVGRELSRRLVAAGVVAVAFATHLIAGGSPIAADFDRAAFAWDARSAAASRLVASVPPDVPVQAPYALMPHLAERELIGPPPPPDRNYEVLIFDTWHRERYRGNEDLLRTSEEPTLRDWLARDTHGLVAVDPPYLMLSRGADPRGVFARPYLIGRVPTDEGRRLASCLGLLGARIDERGVVLDFVARDACPRDLAIRIGSREEPRPRRVDLLFDGLLSPAHLRAGDHARSVHPLSPEERERIAAQGLRIGLLRSSGARPEHADPIAVDVEPES